MLVVYASFGRCREEGPQPLKVAGVEPARDDAGGRETKGLWRGAKQWRMNRPTKVGRGRREVGTISPVGNGEGRMGAGNPTTPRAWRIQHSAAVNLTRGSPPGGDARREVVFRPQTFEGERRGERPALPIAVLSTVHAGGEQGWKSGHLKPSLRGAKRRTSGASDCSAQYRACRW